MADDLRAILDQLEDAKLAYVVERSKTTKDKPAFDAAGIAKATFYTWPDTERVRLNDLAQQLKRQRSITALLILDSAAEHAALVKVGGLDSDDERVQQAAATEILDRTVGKSPERHEVNGSIEVSDAREHLARLIDDAIARAGAGSDPGPAESGGSGSDPL